LRDKGKPIAIRNGLKIYQTLKTQKTLKLVSKKQKEVNLCWRKTTDDKCIELNFTCQWCGLKGTREYYDPNRIEGHHIIPRRFNIHTKKNCYLAHKTSCHKFITDNNIDVIEYPTYEDYTKAKRSK
jgi:5-methylcytosine-specific restriction endonuclease McrA